MSLLFATFTKPYHSIPIQDNGDRLVPIPNDRLVWIDPHPYQALGAPYGDRSPFYLRSEVLKRLLQAQTFLNEWGDLRIQIFDAYRPVAVQQFMVDHTFRTLAAEKGFAIDSLSPAEREALQHQVHQFWAVPSSDPTTPPPHSTGGAVDVTIVDHHGNPLDMGSPIDECSPRSYPDHFASSDRSLEKNYHQHRCLLRESMIRAGFRNHPAEWWHFSYGDQLWAWLISQETFTETNPIAYYGNASFLTI